MTPEERCERVRMALAEAGYPDARVSSTRSDGTPGPRVRGVPRGLVWRALFVSRSPGLRCWPCTERWPLRRDMPEPCDHDPLTSPWPDAGRDAERAAEVDALFSGLGR